MSAIALPFLPDSASVASALGSVRLRFVASLGHLREVVESQTGEACGVEWSRVERWGQLSIPPVVFGAYFDLIAAVEARDWSAARARFGEIATAPELPGEVGYRCFTDPATDRATDRYWRFNDSDPARPIPMCAPSAAEGAQSIASFREAWALLEAADPALFAETRALVTEVFLAAAPADAAIRFGGISCFETLGGIAINVNESRTPAGAYESLIHESCHHLLFLLGHRELTVLNPREELFPSPLRRDPRPMEGIFHATIVIGRMIYGFDVALRLPGLPPETAAAFRSNIGSLEPKFADGVSVVRAHARLTDAGWRILDGAEAYLGARSAVA